MRARLRQYYSQIISDRVYCASAMLFCLWNYPSNFVIKYFLFDLFGTGFRNIFQDSMLPRLHPKCSHLGGFQVLHLQLSLVRLIKVTSQLILVIISVTSFVLFASAVLGLCASQFQVTVIVQDVPDHIRMSESAQDTCWEPLYWGRREDKALKDRCLHDHSSLAM